ncbi:MAG: hypothetical protein NW241_18665 [Bacteroidia bacterium]|nr:hypothetical protein [Bacteroidia bacterium]
MEPVTMIWIGLIFSISLGLGVHCARHAVIAGPARRTPARRRPKLRISMDLALSSLLFLSGAAAMVWAFAGRIG